MEMASASVDEFMVKAQEAREAVQSVCIPPHPPFPPIPYTGARLVGDVSLRLHD